MFGPKSANEAIVYAVEDLIAETQYCIQRVMNEKKISRSSLARSLGCSPANVTQMLSEDSNLRLDTVARIFHALGDKCILNSDFLEGVDSHQSSGEKVQVLWCADPVEKNAVFSGYENPANREKIHNLIKDSNRTYRSVINQAPFSNDVNTYANQIDQPLAA